jgi:hypothetical protein
MNEKTKAPRGAGDVVRLSVRVPKEEWKDMHRFAMANQTSITAVLIEGFKVLQLARGKPAKVE